MLHFEFNIFLWERNGVERLPPSILAAIRARGRICADFLFDRVFLSLVHFTIILENFNFSDLQNVDIKRTNSQLCILTKGVCVQINV